VWNPITDNGIGVAPGLEYHLGTHTNSIVPIYVKGDAGRLLRLMVDGIDPVRGRFVDNTAVYRLISAAVATPIR
jgi:alkaline phosphatase